MEPTVIAALVAGVAAVAVPLVYASLQVKPYQWFERWSKVLDGAQTVEQKRIAMNRIDHHIRDMALYDLLRGTRVIYAVGFILAGVGPVIFVFGLAVVGSLPPLGWASLAIGAAFYIVGLFMIGFLPDMRRERKEAEIDSIASAARQVANPPSRAHRG